MKFTVFVLSLFSVCAGDGYWDIQLSPQSISGVPFGSGHISVWEHASTSGRYYAMPLVHLLPDTASTAENILTGEIEMSFNVLMWSMEAKAAVLNHLRKYVNRNITGAQIEPLPMEKIRVVWKDRTRPLARSFKLADQWRANTHLPAVVTFQFLCQDALKCNSLKSAMKTRPDFFNALELEYIINGQRSARRSTTVTGRHLMMGQLYSELMNMHVTSTFRYLNSDDLKTMTSQSVQNVLGSVTTDSDYVDTNDEVSLTNMLETVLQRHQVSTENFAPFMWESVYWDPAFARPDRMTRYLNRVLTKDTSDSRNFIVNESQRSSSSEGSAGFSFFSIGVSAGSGSSSSTQSKVQKEDVLKTLRERHTNIEWTGEVFRVRPMMLTRLNLATLNVSTSIASASVQIRRYESVQSIKLRVPELTQTPSLTAETVETRLTEKLDAKFAEAQRAIADLRTSFHERSKLRCRTKFGLNMNFTCNIQYEDPNIILN